MFLAQMRKRQEAAKLFVDAMRQSLMLYLAREQRALPTSAPRYIASNFERCAPLCGTLHSVVMTTILLSGGSRLSALCHEQAEASPPDPQAARYVSEGVSRLEMISRP
jgi:hypothetical protein